MNTNKLRKIGKEIWRAWLKPLLLTAAIVFPLRSSVADWNKVPTGSMKPSILEGDHIFVDKLAYDLKVPFTTHHLAKWADPARGDIVVFFSPEDGTRFVKRVVGLPGDMIELRNNQLHINGNPVAYEPLPASGLEGLWNRDLASSRFATELLGEHPHPVMETPSLPALRSTERLRIPAGQYFVLGDNRDNSKDSRYLGCIDRNLVVGRAKTVIASFDAENYHLPRASRFLRSLP